MKRYSGRAKVDFTPNRYVGYGFNLYALYQDYDHMYGRVWNRIICTPPLGTPYDEDGNMVLYPVGGNTADINPLADLNPGEYVSNTKTLTVMPQAYVEVKPLQGLSFKSILGGTLSSRDSGMFIGNESFNGLATGSEARKSNTFTYNYQWQNILTYNLKVADIHNFVFTGITDWQKNRRQFGQAKVTTLTRPVIYTITWCRNRYAEGGVKLCAESDDELCRPSELQSAGTLSLHPERTMGRLLYARGRKEMGLLPRCRLRMACERRGLHGEHQGLAL